jgi:DNA-binding MarR family transcriptional regulator
LLSPLIVEIVNNIHHQRLGALHFFAMSTTAPQKPLLPRLPSELVESTSFLLKRLGMAAKEETIEAFEHLGLSAYHYAVLLVLDEGSRETQGAIADALGFDRGQLVGVLDELEERALVERRRDPNDRRRHLVRLTPAGKRSLAKMRAIIERLETEFFSPLDAKERDTLHALLFRLMQHHDPRCALSLPPDTR